MDTTRKLHNRKAFTIVELIIVIAVISVLASVLVPTFRDVISKAQSSKAAMEDAAARKAFFARHPTVSSATFYSTLNDALGGTNDCGAGIASAAVYEENGRTHIALLRDTECGGLAVSSDVTVHLDGSALQFSSPMVVSADNVVIDGSADESAIEYAPKARSIVSSLIEVSEGSTLTLIGGTYVWEAASGITNMITVAGDLVISDATIIGKQDSGEIYGVKVESTGTLEMRHCTVEVSGSTCVCYGVDSKGGVNIADSSLIALTNYGGIGNNANGKYTSRSSGLRCYGYLRMQNCYAEGTHSGVLVFGDSNIDGGIYQSYGHGGIYFAGAGKTNYLRNATLRWSALPKGFQDKGAGTNQAAMYIGGATGLDNITVYADGCSFEAPMQVICMRGSSNEKNNTIYISNSSINLDYTHSGVRVDNTTHKVYLGSGNNFAVEDVKNRNHQNFDTTNVVFVTEDVYDASYYAD